MLSIEPLNPYPGLRPFRTDEDYLFFGREEQTAQLLTLLRQHRFLAVVGASGSGKSSLVRAGLLPALHGGSMTQAGSSWQIVLLKPGGDPITNLARAMIEAEMYDAGDQESLPQLLATLHRSRNGLVEAVKQSALDEACNLLIVVDQFEELFRFRQSGIESQESASAFVKLLLGAARQTERPIYVTITMRSDYLGECAEIPGLAEAVNDGEYLIPRLNREQRRAAIEKPSAVRGARIATRLSHRLLNDVGDDADQLPVLQHAMMRMWEFWARDHADGEPLDLRHYEVAGGLAEALSRHADEIYNGLPDDRHRLVAEKLFKALTERGPDNRGIRRPTRLAHLCAILDAAQEEVVTVTDAFRAPGVTFLMPMQDTPLAARTVIDISHESLMRVWKRLDLWVEEESQSARIYRRLAETAALYAEGRAGVYHDPDLQIALTWRDRTDPTEAWGARYHPAFQQAIEFLEVSGRAKREQESAREAARQKELEQARILAEAQRQRAEEQLRSARRLRGLAAGLGVLALVAVGAFMSALAARRQAEHSALVAQAEAKRADGERQRAEQAQAKAEDEALRAEGAFQEAEFQRKLTRRSLYYSNIAQALLASEMPGGARRLAQLLAPWRPTAGESDLRGWEWHYLNSRHDRDVQTIDTRRLVIRAVYSPDGKKLAGCSPDGSISIWDVPTHREALTLIGHGRAVYDVQWSPSGRELASTGNDQMVRIWDGETAFPIRTIPATGRSRIAWSPDGRRLAAVSVDAQGMEVLDVATGDVLNKTQTPAPSRACDWSPDGTRLAIASGKDVLLWDGARGEITSSLKGHTTAVWDVKWRHDGGRIASCDDSGTVSIWNPVDGSRVNLQRDQSGSVLRLAWSPDGNSLATAGFDGAVTIWNGSTGTRRRTLAGHNGFVYSVDWSPDGDHLATTGFDQSIKLWNVRAESASWSDVVGSHDGWANSVTWSPDGRKLASAGDDGTVKVWSMPSRELLLTIEGHSSYVNSVAWSLDGGRIASGSADKTVRIWEPKTGASMAVLTGHDSPINCVAWAPDGKRIAACGWGDGRVAANVYVWELPETGAPSKTTLAVARGNLLSVAWSPDGKLLAAGGGFTGQANTNPSPQVTVWDSREQVQVHTFALPTEATVNAISFSPDGTQLAASSYQRFVDASVDAAITIWDIQSGASRSVLRSHTDQINSIAWSPDATRIVSASSDQTIKIFSVESQLELLSLHPHGGQVSAAAIGPDGTCIASAGSDGKVRILDAAPSYREEKSDKLLAPLSEKIATGTADADDYQLHGEILAGHARWSEAQGDFEKSAELRGDSAVRWLVGPWWVVGPYPEDLAATFPPETNPDPLRKVASADGETMLTWASALSNLNGGLDLSRQFDRGEHMSCYAYTRVYANGPQQTGLLLGSDDLHRVWLNGRLVHQNLRPRVASPDQDAVLVTLRPGWNDVLVKVVNITGGYGLYLRCSEDPIQLARVFERNLQFEEALAQWNRAIEQAPGDASLIAQRTRTEQLTGRLDLALAGASSLLEKYPDNVGLLEYRAMLYAEQGRWDEAIADTGRAENLRPNDWEIKFARGHLLACYGETIPILPPSKWRWLHPVDGRDPAEVDAQFHTKFAALDYDDSGWQVGQDTRGTAGGFGFENRSWNRRSFAVDIGKPASGAQTTAYFRHRFRTQVELAELYVRLQRQDGVIVYLDGVEVGRDNMTDSEGFRSRSRTSVTFDAESRPIIIRLSGTLPAGEHVIAISLHGSGSPNASLRIAEISLHGRPVGQDLIALERPSDLFTRGLAFLELNQSEKGEADFAKAYELLGGAGVASSDKLSKALLRVADVYRDKNDLAFALKVVDLAVMADSKSADALHSRGSLLARQLKWKEAAEYLSHAVELAPDNYLFSYPLSPILVELGQLDRYREHCAQMVKRFAAADVVSAGSIMQDCLWLPDSVTDWQSLIDLWKSITEELPVWQRDTRRAILGLFEYRAGRPEAAIALIQNNTDSLDAANKVQALAMLAMAYQDTGRTDEAKSTLQQAEGLLDSARPDLGHAYSWHDWLAARILRREAVGRIRGSGDRWFVEAQDLEAEGRLDEALERLARPEVEQAAGPRMFVLRANIWARRGNEREAAAEYVRAADRANEDTIAWMRGAALLAESPDVQAYQAYCAKMLAQFAETARPEFAERVAKAGLLLAPVPPELEGALKLADKSVTIDPAHWVIPWAQPIKGLAEYRRGNYQNAIDWAQKTLDGSSRVWYHDTLSHLVKAMAQKQLGLDEPAQKSLAAAKELIDPKTQQIESDGLHDDWHDWKIDCILLREAEGLIKNIR